MVLVTGATGHLGGATVNSLLTKISPSEIAVFVRDPRKAEELKSKGIQIRQGDYDDYASLIKAFAGIDKLYFVSGSDIMKRGAQHSNVVNAAKETGIKHVVYTSFERKNETETSPIALVAKAHLDTEKQLKEAGLTYTILKDNVYTDMLPMFIGDKVLETGIIFLPAGEGKASFALRSDIAEAAANILTSGGHENETYTISGNVSYSYQDIAKMISEISGKKITYVSPSQEEFKEELKKAAVPAEYIGILAGFSEAIRQGEFDNTDETLEKLLGRKPTPIQEFLRHVYLK